MINGLGHLSNVERLERLYLWTLEERRNKSDLIDVFKIIKGYIRNVQSAISLFLDNRCKGTRGHSAKLILSCLCVVLLLFSILY